MALGTERKPCGPQVFPPSPLLTQLTQPFWVNARSGSSIDCSKSRGPVGLIQEGQKPSPKHLLMGLRVFVERLCTRVFHTYVLVVPR